MRKIFFILFVIHGFILNAQNSTIEITNFTYEVEGDERVCSSNIVLTAVFNDGSTEEVFSHHRGKVSNGTHTYNYDDIFTQYPKKLISLRIFADVTEKRGLSCGGGNDSYLDHDDDIELNLNSCLDNFYSHERQNNGEFEVRHKVVFDYKISTTVDVITNSGSLGFDDVMTINADPSFNDNSYNWQYQIVSNTTNSLNPNLWINLARPITPNTLEFTAKDILTTNSPEFYIGKYVYFRIQPCYNGHPNGNIRFFKILPSAPHITSIINNDGLMCNGTEDAEITLVFDKALEPGQTFALSIVDLSTPDNEVVTAIDEVNSSNLINKTLTIGGLRGSNPEGFRVELVGGTTLFTSGTTHTIDFEVFEPDYVTFNITNYTNVNCKDGQDGTISIEANGGTLDNYEYSILNTDGTDGAWVPFDNTNTHTIASNITAATYRIKVRDGNECVAKVLIPNIDNELVPDQDEDLVLEQVIEEPNAALEVEFLPVTTNRLTDSNDATANGFTDGRIIAVITGGTAPYNVVWKSSTTGETLTTVTNIIDTDRQTTTLDNIGADTYSLQVTDANFTAAVQKEACFVNAIFIISEPEELTLNIEETKAVSCNSANEFDDPINDGELVAHAKGGIQLDVLDNNGLPYYYTWKKEDNTGVFQELTQEKDSVLSNLNSGRYAVNIRDANNIVIGNYVNNVLVDPTDVEHNLLDPEPISITFTKGDLKCNDSTNGWAQAMIVGGTGNYTLKWSTNNATTPRVENLEKGTYFLFVTDEKGCQATSQVSIEAPNALQVSILQQTNPICNNGSDGIISLDISGGLEDYTYNWLKNGDVLNNQTGFYANNLTAGIYAITVTDKNLCTETVEITLENPDPDLINLGDDRLLCGGQSVVLDATYQGEGTTYLWTSDKGFTSTTPIIEITEAGTYTVEVTTQLGCSGGDSIVITTSDTPIDAHFVVSTQAFAGEEVALVNISEPLGEKVEWFFPPEAVIMAETNENAILLFDKPGSYEIILRSNQGTCFLDHMKTIIIEEPENIPDIGDAETPFIEDFIIYPNPSSGEFQVNIALSDPSPITLKIFSMASQGLIHEREENAAANFTLEYTISLASGTYLLLLETAKGSEIRKIATK